MGLGDFAKDPMSSFKVPAADDLLRLVFNHAGEGISVFDGALRIVAWNQRFLDCTGVPADLVQPGVALAELLRDMAQRGEFGPCDIEAEIALRCQILGDGQATLTQRVRPNGQTLELRRTPTPDGGFMMLYADVSERLGTETALADQQRMLGLLQQRTEQGFWFIDNALCTTDVNPAMCRMLRLPREALLGRTIYDFVDEANAEIFREHVRRRTQGVADGYEITLLRGDGTRVHCYNNATPIFDAKGRKIGAVGLFSDISALTLAQRALQESEQRFRAMADAAPALIWMSNAEGVATWFNQRWLQYTGRSLQAELACTWFDRMVAEDHDRCWQLFAAAGSRREAYEVEYRLLRSDGQTRWIVDNGIPRLDAEGRFEGYAVYGWDITARKAAQSALRAAKDDAERANRAKSEFLSRMSHELRTPLNAVLGFAQLLQADQDEPLSPKQSARVAELLRGGQHLLHLINEVLDLARIEAGTLRLALNAVAVDQVVSDSLRMVQPMAEQRGITLRLQAPPQACHVVQADRMRLDQVLLNLLSNAIKYNKPGGDVLLAWRDEPDTTSVLIEVTDTGPGLSAEQQDRLFQAFERLDAEGSTVEGAGIGLALSKWLVDLMQGQIGVRSVPGEGSAFWVRLSWLPQDPDRPADALEARLIEPAAPTDAVTMQPATVPWTRRKTVLYIEDNEVNQLLMQGMLTQRPQIDLLLADLPETGLALAQQRQPDLLLLDIQLPGIDGFEVMCRLKADARTRSIPVVAVSANAMEGDIAAARQAGFVDYITKPLSLHRLLAVVDALLAR